MNYYQDPMYYAALARRLEVYIKEELKDASYYAILSDKSPTQRAQRLLLEFSSDEMQNAQDFMKAYYSITGRYFAIPPSIQPVVPEYEEALKERLIEETSHYKRYGHEYIKAPTKYLQELFFSARTREAVHSMRIPLLLEEEVD